ncbi:MAG: cytochrome C class I [Acidocella sp. 20-63-7]|nr:MAG: cytochrome C class I [Acidocella sp. 20-63-7]HQT46356.1 c-type cytochrome [Acidocella sp.]
MSKALFSVVVLTFVAGAAYASPPSLQDLPSGPLGQSIQRGHDMIMNTTTDPEVKGYIGNALTCNSCHTDGGNNNHPGNFLITATKFPAFSPREGAVITLADRVANCFMRSMNGTRPGADSKVVVDMEAYITWLDRGKTIYSPPPAKEASPYPAMLKAATHADVVAGAAVYTTSCAACHGAQGAGMPSAFPPVWGATSYNAGAGLANVAKLAVWVKGNMPLDNAHLSNKEAFDVALYIDTHPRPDFNLSQHLPAGITPDDYNASVRAEVDSVEGNLKRAGLSLQTLLGPSS